MIYLLREPHPPIAAIRYLGEAEKSSFNFINSKQKKVL